MSSRDTMHASLRQLADLRLASAEIEHELDALKREQRDLDRQIAVARRRGRQTPARRFWHGLGLGVFVVSAVWVTALGVAHLAIGH
ncbi:MAG: hypothetical protein SF187_02995 [Deltaproteobacteria bacterium]|nr:hypothetical protein [Deltaproteobacteria bacterium]